MPTTTCDPHSKHAIEARKAPRASNGADLRRARIASFVPGLFSFTKLHSLFVIGLILAVWVAGAGLSHADPPPARSAVTHHVGTFNGKIVHYTAWVQDNHVLDEQENPGATVITIAYTRDEVKNPKQRPIIFAFNGGPGAASAILNYQAIGPVRLVGQVAGKRSTGHFENNPYSLLDAADLVFIDPVGTGFSRVFSDSNEEYWYSGKTDAVSVISAIKHWLKDHDREGSPLYLLGESYGTWRVGFMLQNSSDLSFQGVILVGLYVPVEGSVMPYVTALPTMAAGAWYHHKIDRNGRTVGQVFNETIQFARTDYVSALMQSVKLDPASRKRIAEHMSKLIGLPASFIEEHHLRIDENTYMFNLMGDPHVRTGKLDVRVTGPLGPNERGGLDDPALAVVASESATAPAPTPFSVGPVENPRVGSYIKNKLDFPAEQSYYTINFLVNGKWRREKCGFNPVRAIGAYASKHPSMRIMWAQGMYDLSTPAYQALYALNQNWIVSKRLTTKLILPGPHSVYEGDENLRAFTAALRKFVTAPSKDH